MNRQPLTFYVSRFTLYVTLLAILLLAAFLRFYRLDAQSFWNDEGNSARLAERSLDLIIEGAAGDIHPPGYYIILHCWRALFGQSEFALRSLSVVAGLTLIVLTYLWSRALFGESTGLIAAFLSAISPFAIYYSQEARMYALLAALAAASAFVSYRVQVRSCKLQVAGSKLQVVDWIAYVLLGAAGLYTHYAFAFVLIANNLLFGLRWLAGAERRRWERLAVWAGAQVAVLLLYLPWVPTALNAAGWSSPRADYELGRALLDILRVLTVGITQPLGEATAALIIAGALLIVATYPGVGEGPSGAIAASEADKLHEEESSPSPLTPLPVRERGVASLSPRGEGRGEGESLILLSPYLYLLTPVILFFAFDLYKPAWLKFLIIALPPFHLLIAHAIQQISSFTLHVLRFTFYVSRFTFHVSRFTLQVSRFTFCALLALITYPSLQNLYFDPAYARDDYRQIAADIRAVSRPGSAVILNAPNQWEVFTYYYPDQDVYPAPYRPSVSSAERFLKPIIEEHDRLFVLYWGDAESDPQRRVEAWLATHTYKASDRWYGDVRLATYGVAPLPEGPDEFSRAHFGENIFLHGYTLARDGLGPGDIAPVALFWEAEGAIDERYKVTVQALDGAGNLVAQVDTEPRDGLLPTTLWEPVQVVADFYGLPLPPELPPGRYRLIVGLYHVSTGERLPVTRADGSVGNYLPLGHFDLD